MSSNFIESYSQLKKSYNKYNSSVKFKDLFAYFDQITSMLNNLEKRLDILEKTIYFNNNNNNITLRLNNMRDNLDNINNFLSEIYHTYKA